MDLNKIQIFKEVVDLNKIVKDEAKMFEEQIEAKDLKLVPKNKNKLPFA